MSKAELFAGAVYHSLLGCFSFVMDLRTNILVRSSAAKLYTIRLQHPAKATLNLVYDQLLAGDRRFRCLQLSHDSSIVSSEAVGDPDFC